MDSSPPWPAACEADSAEAKIEALQAELLRIERRLGTADERAEDLRNARDAAHAISNVRMRVAMLRELARHKDRCASKRAL